MTTGTKSAQSTTLIPNLSWATYESLLRDLRDRTAPRVTYDRGMLEIMSPTREHEQYNRAIAALVSTIAEELGIDVLDLGSMTYRREDLLRGFEPDSSFYIQNLDRVAGKSEIDLSVDPPPDLVIEVDITSSSLDKLPIYAEMAVPEVWRYDGSQLSILLLNERSASYNESGHSAAFPMLTGSLIASFVEDSKSLKSTAWLKKLRGWVRLSR